MNIKSVHLWLQSRPLVALNTDIDCHHEFGDHLLFWTVHSRDRPLNIIPRRSNPGGSIRVNLEATFLPWQLNSNRCVAASYACDFRT